MLARDQAVTLSLCLLGASIAAGTVLADPVGGPENPIQIVDDAGDPVDADDLPSDLGMGDGRQAFAITPIWHWRTLFGIPQVQSEPADVPAYITSKDGSRFIITFQTPVKPVGASPSTAGIVYGYCDHIDGLDILTPAGPTEGVGQGGLLFLSAVEDEAKRLLWAPGTCSIGERPLETITHHQGSGHIDAPITHDCRGDSLPPDCDTIDTPNNGIITFPTDWW